MAEFLSLLSRGNIAPRFSEPSMTQKQVKGRNAPARAAARRKTSLVASVVLMVILMTTTMSRTNTMGSRLPLAFVSSFTKRSIATRLSAHNAGIVPRRTFSAKPFSLTTSTVPGPLTIREGSRFYAKKTTSTTIKANNSEDTDVTGAMQKRTVATSASSEAATPFEKLFQSTLERAYSTTATLENFKENVNIDPTTDNAKGNYRTDDDSVDPSAAVNSILDATIVETTNAESSQNPSKQKRKQAIASNVNSVLDETITTTRDKYSRRTETKKQRQTQEHHSKKNASSRYEFPFATSYKSHPALNNVALAHALWASVVRPNADTVIDATCGNGNDSIVLAEILFANQDNNTPSELLCVDVQSLACERTTEALREVLSPSIQVIGPEAEGDYDGKNNQVVRVLNASHEKLPRPADPLSSVGLIVYNLGWLPGTGDSDGKDCVTTMETTMASMVDATLLLRVGGMLSVITYPQTGPDEDTAVRLFVTCLALLSSRTRTWQEEIRDFQGPPAVANIVKASMETVVSRGNQTWRVSQHDKLGMDRPPVLFTATRIK